MQGRFRRIVPHTVMLVAAGFLWWAATRIDVETGGRIGPAVWPKAVIAFMAILCVYEIVKRLIFLPVSIPPLAAAMPAAPEAEGAAEPRPVPAQHLGKLAAGVGLVIGYVLAVPWLGFFVTTAIFLAVFPWAGGLRRPALSAVLGLAGSLALLVVFMRVAYISLPLGEGPFRALSLALMRLIGVT